MALMIEGDASAFETLYRFYFTKIYTYALTFVKSTELAEDIAQDVFIKIWENRENMQEVRSFKAYLFAICKNATLTLLTRAARETKVKELILRGASRFYMDQELYIHNQENRELLEKAISQLPPKRQQIFRLCKLEGKTYDEVAEKLHISPGTINDHIVKATRQIRAFLLPKP
jgi:RNA polymerase sigma-70 factor (family 1)